MSKSRHTEAKMIGALKPLEAGRKAEDVAREVGCLALEVDTSFAGCPPSFFEEWDSTVVSRVGFLADSRSALVGRLPQRTI
jgi:hypothetical protein